MHHIKLIGGLGHQLFQYAYAYNLFKQNKKVKLEAFEFKYYDLHKLKIQNFKINLKFSKWHEVKDFYIFKNLFLSYQIKKIWKKIFIFLHKLFNYNSIIYENLKNTNLKRVNLLHDGYWQKLKYAEGCKKELFQQIKLNKYSSKHKKLINQISSKKNSVAIQIRIFSKVGGEDKFHKNISSKYIEKAKKKIQNKVNKPFYFIFTNSSNWVSENLNLNKSNYILVKGFEDFEDLISISKCNIR